MALALGAGDPRWELAGAGTPTRVSGALHEIAAYLTGRPNRLTATDDAPAALPAWL